MTEPTAKSLTPPRLGMRDAFFEGLLAIAREDPRVVVITADFGAPALDQFSQELPRQFFTVGIAEQQMIGMACGLALEGFKVYTYAIAPFVTGRVYEQVKLDLCAMNLPVVNLGVGAGYAYDNMGPTHHTVDDLTLMRVLPNLTLYSPADPTTARALARLSYEAPGPVYIRFDRGGLPDLYREGESFRSGMGILKEGEDLYLVATGVMVHQALRVAEALEPVGIRAGVVDLYRIKPFPKEAFLACVRSIPRIVTLEEHLLAGGLGSLVLEVLSDVGCLKPVLRIGQQDRFVFEYGGREVIWARSGLSVDQIRIRILTWME